VRRLNLQELQLHFFEVPLGAGFSRMLAEARVAAESQEILQEHPFGLCLEVFTHPRLVLGYL
jgi:hypothetical protein